MGDSELYLYTRTFYDIMYFTLSMEHSRGEKNSAERVRKYESVESKASGTSEAESITEAR